jgi:hypothetical protein
MVSDHELDSELNELRSNVGADPGVQSKTADLVLALEDAGTRRQMEQGLSRRRRWRLGVGLSILGLAIAAPAAAVGVSQWNAHTGTYGGEGTEIVDQSEWIAFHAADAPEAIAQLYPAGELPLPPGASDGDVISPVSDILARIGGEGSQPVMQETTIRLFFENGARCLWYRYWLYTDEDDDQTGRDIATAGIQESLTWPATTASLDDGADAYLREQADAATAGDRMMMVRYYGRSCDAFGRIFQ